jgi:type III restriction enzyme
MSQLLCEQVVGRGLRRMDYEPREDGRFTEEVAMVFGVPFEVVPFKAGAGGGGVRQDRKHVRALPNRADMEIQFPRLEGYTQAIRNRIRVDWSRIARIRLDPFNIPPEVDMKAGLINNQGRPSLSGPGPRREVTLREFREKHRLQELIFELAGALARDYANQPKCEALAVCHGEASC